MKKRRWLFVVLGALSLILASCALTPPTVDVPSAGLRTSDGELELSGTGLAGYEVQVVVDGEVLGVTQAGEDGTWSLRVTFTKPGEQELRVQTLSRGIAISESPPIPVSVAGVPEPQAQAAQATEAPAAEVTLPSVKLPAGGALEAGASVLTGSAEPGSEVQVLVDGEVVGVAEVGADGTWSLEVSLVEPGEHELSVQALDASGQVVAEAEPVAVSLAVEAEAEAAPARAVSPAVAPELVFPVDGADVLTGELTLIGSGASGAEVEVLNGSAVLGSAQVGADGEWRYTFEPGAGNYRFAVRSVADTAAPDAFVEVRVTSDEKSIDCFSNPGIDRGQIFVVGTCDTLEDISKLLGIDLDELIAANPQVEDPDMIYPGEFVTIP